MHRSWIWMSTLAAILLIAGGCGSTASMRPDDAASSVRTQDDSLPGSTDHARVAIPTDGGRKELVFLGGSLTDDELAQLRRTAPNVRIIMPQSSEEALRLAPRAHGVDGRFCSPEFLDAADQLVWVQSPSAGVERYVDMPGLRGSGRIVLTNMQGVHGPTIAEHAFAMLLSLTRDLRYYLQPEQRGTWDRSGSDVEPMALNGRTMLVVGLGGIGSEVAKRARGFNMRVLATRRSTTPPPPYVDRQGTPGDLHDFLPQADVVVLSVPLTDETAGMIGERELAMMKPGSYLINVARGPVVETDALVEALSSGHLAGACLDVTDPEPLPREHPLWAMSNVVITPHVSSRSALTLEQWKALYLENLRRFGAGEPLLNVVDVEAGY